MVKRITIHPSDNRGNPILSKKTVSVSVSEEEEKKANEILTLLKYSKQMNESEIRRLFTKVLGKFFNQEMNDECLDAIAEKIYWIDGFHKHLIELDLLRVLEEASDLFYNKWQLKGEPDFDEIFQKYISPLKNFYEANKSLLKKA